MIGLASLPPVVVLLLGLALAGRGLAQEDPQAAEPVSPPETSVAGGSSTAEQPQMEDLGDGRYRIGKILVDKPGRRFTVPGRIIHLQDVLEYVAVARGGMKEYESLLELDATATEFQLACILIGLDDKNSVKPRYQFDENDAIGPPVAIDLSWERDGKTKTIPVANALRAGYEEFDDHRWVYIGSITELNGEFMANTVGTLIGFVHDPYAIIEHRKGAGIGEYGLIKANAMLLPPEGAPVTISVSAKAE